MASRLSPRRQRVVPSAVRSETFLLALVVLGLALYVPYLLRSGGDIKNPNRQLYPSQVANSPVGVVPTEASPPIGPGPYAPSAQQPVLGQPGVERPPPPITYIIPYLLSFGRAIFRLSFGLPYRVYSLLKTFVFWPLSYPLSLFLAIIRPITLLAEVIYDLFLKTPIAILTWFLREAVYPIYVFTGIAVIIGGTVGYSASHVPKAAVYLAEQVRSNVPYFREQGRLTDGSSMGKPTRFVAFEGTGTDFESESDATEVPPYRGGATLRRSF